MAGEVLDRSTVLSGTVVSALEMAATARRGQPLTTAQVLVALMRNDVDADGWARIALHCRAFDQIDVSAWPDPDGSTAVTWQGVPLSPSLEESLRVAERMAQDYRLVPLPPVALALGLVADPFCGASRSLVEGRDIDHPALVDLIQDALSAGRFEGWSASVRRPEPGDQAGGVLGPFGAEASVLKSTAIVPMITISGVGLHPKGHPVTEEENHPYRIAGRGQIALLQEGASPDSSSELLMGLAVTKRRVVVAVVWGTVPLVGSFDFDRANTVGVLALDHLHLDEIAFHQKKRRLPGRRSLEQLSIGWIAPGRAAAFLRLDLAGEVDARDEFRVLPVPAESAFDRIRSLARPAVAGVRWDEGLNEDGWRSMRRADD